MTDEIVRVGDLIELKCMGCSKKFQWKVPANWIYCVPSFHSQTCRNRAGHRRNKSQEFRPCPHPFKRAYHHKPWAEEEARRQAEGRQMLYREYRCRCGAYHVGHRKFKVLKRAKDLVDA